jgi:hypothetical protein
MKSGRHCEPTGRRKAPPDDRLREAIQPLHAEDWIASSRSLSSGAHPRDPLAPRNDDFKSLISFSLTAFSVGF